MNKNVENTTSEAKHTSAIGGTLTPMDLKFPWMLEERLQGNASLILQNCLRGSLQHLKSEI